MCPCTCGASIWGCTTGAGPYLSILTKCLVGLWLQDNQLANRLLPLWLGREVSHRFMDPPKLRIVLGGSEMQWNSTECNYQKVLASLTKRDRQLVDPMPFALSPSCHLEDGPGTQRCATKPRWMLRMWYTGDAVVKTSRGVCAGPWWAAFDHGQCVGPSHYVSP